MSRRNAAIGIDTVCMMFMNWIKYSFYSCVFIRQINHKQKIHPALAWSVHMPGESQTIRDFTFCRPSQICRYWSDLNRQKSVPDTLDIEFGGKEWKERQKLKFVCCTPMYDRETGSQRFRRVGNERNPSPTSPMFMNWIKIFILFLCTKLFL